MKITSRTEHQINLGGKVFHIKFRGGDLLYYDGDDSFEFQTSIPPNVWTHVTFTSYYGDIKIYINGVLSIDYNAPNPDIASYSYVTLGSDYFGENFKGSIDDFRFYDRELSEAKVQELYQLDRPNTTGNSSISLWNTNDNGVYYSDGHVEIGNVTAPDGYGLYVEEGILTEKVKISMKDGSQWADYVFAPEYDLKPLSEVEDYVKTHQHLPGIPSADSLIQTGIDLVQMNAKLLEED